MWNPQSQLLSLSTIRNTCIILLHICTFKEITWQCIPDSEHWLKQKWCSFSLSTSSFLQFLPSGLKHCYWASFLNIYPIYALIILTTDLYQIKFCSLAHTHGSVQDTPHRCKDLLLYSLSISRQQPVPEEGRHEAPKPEGHRKHVENSRSWRKWKVVRWSQTASASPSGRSEKAAHSRLVPETRRMEPAMAVDMTCERQG